ncbi:hypothetical protein PEC106568_21610 [Pectobacterium carotovorum subsp. carotovorum]|nr:hypothetical protein PEC106568_21610 [Pectobacterium carotovorum subsp. carotovorum]
MALICELDEQWSFVGSKVGQHWLWYAYNTKTGGVLAYTFGSRIDDTCRELLALLTRFSIGMITSDDWGSYAREVPKDKHLTGKIFTQCIERNNLTLRTQTKRLASKTICFSRSIENHEKVIVAFIEKYMFYYWKITPDVFVFEPKIFGDERGFFFESFNQWVFEEPVGRKVEFVQDNHSKSCKGALRGLHYQLPPYAQGKLVRCTVGEVFDVAVYIRKNSSTFGKCVGVNLSAGNKLQFWIPESFVHGFIALKNKLKFFIRPIIIM